MKLINLIKQLYWKIRLGIYPNEYQFLTEDELGMHHIWGIKSWDDLTQCDCCFYTMNDFDITYYDEEKKYRFGVETVYCFENHEEEKEYILGILNQLTNWMKSQGYKIDYEYELYDVFTTNLYEDSCSSGFDTIEELYRAFKFFVYGYLGVNEKVKSSI